MMNKLNFNNIYGAALIFVSVAGFAVDVSGTAMAATDASQKQGVTITSEAVIERVVVDDNGQESVQLKQPKDVVVVPGDKVKFTNSYANNGIDPAEGFRATNQIPNAVRFVEVQEDWAEVSVDGGVTWGKLPDLRVNVAPTEGEVAVTRPAIAADVTHVHWIFDDPVAPGANGSVSYTGIVK